MNQSHSSSTSDFYNAPQTVDSMRQAWLKLLSTMSSSQVDQTQFPFEDSHVRTYWHFFPQETWTLVRHKWGTSLEEMNQEQKTLAFELMQTALSERGFSQGKAIIELEAFLGELEKQHGTSRRRRDPGLYFFSLFGDPSGNLPWGWRIMGHHLVLNFSIVNGELLTTTPNFFGVHPARVHSGPKTGLRILSDSEDIARELVTSLNEKQRSDAIISDLCPREIFTFNSIRVELNSPVTWNGTQYELKNIGLPAKEMDANQNTLLMRLIGEYVERMPAETSAKVMDRIKTQGLDQTSFTWMGSTTPREAHYYRIHGPFFLTEYECAQDDADHIHSVWRDLDNDFGFDLLENHYKLDHHNS